MQPLLVGFGVGRLLYDVSRDIEPFALASFWNWSVHSPTAVKIVDILITDADSDPADADSDATESKADALSRRSLAQLGEKSRRRVRSIHVGVQESIPKHERSLRGRLRGGSRRVKGTTGDTWCVKPCTDAERKVCDDQECPKGK